MTDNRALAPQTREPGSTQLPDFGAPSPRRGMARVQRGQLAHGLGGNPAQASLAPLREKIGEGAPAQEIADIAQPLLANPELSHLALGELASSKRAAEILSLIDDPNLGNALYTRLGDNLQSDVLHAQSNHVSACQKRAEQVWALYQEHEETVREHYPGHWTALRSTLDFRWETIGGTRWDHVRVARSRMAFLDRAEAMLPGIRERKKREADSAVHRQVQPILGPILRAKTADGSPVHWVRIWDDVMNADRQYIGNEAARNYVRAEVSRRNHELVQVADRRAVAGLARAEADGGVGPAEHMAAYRTTRSAIEDAWSGSAPETRDSIAGAAAGENYELLAEPLRAQTQGMLETYAVLAEVIRGDKTAGDNARDTFSDDPRRRDTNDKRAAPFAPLSDQTESNDLQPVTMEDVARADASAFMSHRLEHDPIFKALQMTQEGGDQARRGAILIAQMADKAEAWSVGHEFYRVAFGVPQELPDDTDELRAALDQYKPRGGEFAAAWDQWVEDHDIYREWFNLKTSTWNVVVSLTLHLALAVLAGLISGGIGAAYKLSTASVVLMEALIFTVSAEALSAGMNGHGMFEGGAAEFATDMAINASSMGVLRMVGPGYKALMGVDASKLARANTTFGKLVAHKSGLLLVENLAMDGVAIGLAAAEAAMNEDSEFTADQAWEIVVTNAALSLCLKLGQAGGGLTRSLLPGRSIPGLMALDARITANHANIAAGRGRRETAIGQAQRQKALLAEKDGLLASNLGTSSAEYQNWRAVYDFLLSEVKRFELVKSARLQQVGAGRFEYAASRNAANQVRQRLENSDIPFQSRPTPDGQTFTFKDPVSGAQTTITPSGGPKPTGPRPNAQSTPETVFTSSGVAVHLPQSGGLRHVLESHTVEGFDPVARVATSPSANGVKTPHDATLFKPGTATNPQELHTLLRQALEGRHGRGVVDGEQTVLNLTLRNQPVRVALGPQSGGGTKLLSIFPTRGVTVRKNEILKMADDVTNGRRTLQEIRDELRERF